jgi:hypothetical protein
MLKELFPQTYLLGTAAYSVAIEQPSIQGDGMSSPMQICLWEKFFQHHWCCAFIMQFCDEAQAMTSRALV